MDTREGQGDPRMAADSSGSRALLLTWEVQPDREEHWRRLLQELSEAPRRKEEHVRARRRLGISMESMWLVPKRGGSVMAVVYLEAKDPEQALRELAASETLFDSWYSGGINRLFAFDFARLTREAGGELLFAWRDGDGIPDER